MKKVLAFLPFLLLQGVFGKEHELLVCKNPMELKELTALARNNRSDIQASRENTQQKKSYEYATLANHFPQVSLTVTTQKSQSDTLPEQLLQLSLSQPIFAPASIFIPYKIAQVATETSRIETELQQNNAQLEVEQSFFQQRIAFKRKKLGSALSLSAPLTFEKGQKSLENGLISAVEFEQYKANYESDLSSLEKIAQEAKMAENQLKLATEQTKIKNLVWISAPQLKHAIQIALGYKPKALLENSLKKRPDLQLLEHAAKIAELENIHSRANYLPTASLFANMYATKKSNTALGTAETLINYPWVVGINFSWNFDSLSSMFTARAAHAEYLAQILKKKRAEWSIAKEVSNSLHQLKIDEKLLQAAKQAFQSGKKTFEQKEIEFSAGLLAESDFFSAKTEWENVLANYVQQTALVGNDYALFNFRTGNQLPLTSKIIPEYQG